MLRPVQITPGDCARTTSVGECEEEEGTHARRERTVDAVFVFVFVFVSVVVVLAWRRREVLGTMRVAVMTWSWPGRCKRSGQRPAREQGPVDPPIGNEVWVDTWPAAIRVGIILYRMFRYDRMVSSIWVS